MDAVSERNIITTADVLTSLQEDSLEHTTLGADTNTNKLRLFDNEWPQPIICSAEVEKEDKKAKRRIKKDQQEICRDNLITIFKLVSKELMDSSLVHGRLLDDQFVPLQQFFTVLEHIFLHNLKSKKLALLSANKEFYSLLEQVQKFSPDAAELTHTVKDMQHIKTAFGRGRAWLRLAMMQKKLADCVKTLVDRKEILCEYYDSGAVLLEEDAHLLCGLMVGLNCIDCHLNIKDSTSLDSPVEVIDYSLYLSEASLPGPGIDHTESDLEDSDLTLIRDQNRFLEEHNTHLTTALSDLKSKFHVVQSIHTTLVAEHSNSTKLLKDIQTENELYRTENNRLTAEFDRKLQATENDVETERTTYQTSREGLEQMYTECQRRLKDEIKLRQEAEKEVQLQINMRTETEMATRLLEKDVHEKQDLIVALRNQISDVKGYNIEMYSKQQLLEGQVKAKSSEVQRLETIMQAAKSEKDKMNMRLQQVHQDKQAAEDSVRSIADQLSKSDDQRSTVETDLRIEREYRVNIQQSLDEAQAKIQQLSADAQRLKSVEQELTELKIAHKDLQTLCENHESALTDMAKQLSDSKLRHEDLREVQQALKEAHWADDDLATQCKQCEKAFNISRRKHHCRCCGDIFCNECSDQKMALPSSAKPVRVCDNCQVILLSRASKT